MKADVADAGSMIPEAYMMMNVGRPGAVVASVKRPVMPVAVRVPSEGPLPGDQLHGTAELSCRVWPLPRDRVPSRAGRYQQARQT